MHDHTILIRLTDLVDGQPFDGLVAGTFVSMSGRKVEVKDEDLAEYEANTQGAIEATRTESGELVGLPIDLQWHDHDDAAGYIVDVKLEDGILRFTPRWTDLGREVLQTGKRRWFSAEFDTARKIIEGGSLTNWPASKDMDTGYRVLRPIELAQLSNAAFTVDEESLDERVFRIQRAWWEGEYQREGTESFITSGGVYDNFVIIERSDGYFKVAFSEGDEGEIVFAPPDEWTEVKKTWVELARQMFGRVLDLFARREADDLDLEDENTSDRLGKVSGKNTSKGDKDMTIKLSDLKPEEVDQLVDKLAERLGSKAPVGDAAPESEKLTQLIDKLADQRVVEQLAAREREMEIARLSKGLVEGTDEVPAGLPTTEDEIKAFLGSLNDEQREAAVAIFDKVLANGIVNFATRGHSRHVEGKTQLSDSMKKELRKYLAENKDNTVERFFEINAVDLGAMSEYDIAEFKKEGE